MSKPTRLVYKGRLIPVAWDEDGNVTRKGPDQSFPGIPARDIDAEEFHIFDLDAKRIKEITAGDDPLYVAEHDDEPAQSESKADAKTEDAPEEKPASKSGKRG